MDRHWLLTSTTYGTWLPGDERGFAGPVRDEHGHRVQHNAPGTPYEADLPNLRRFTQKALKGPPLFLNREQAEALLIQFQETAAYRDWLLLAVAIMANHFHILVGVLGDPDPEKLLGDFKAYASRALNRRWGKPISGT